MPDLFGKRQLGRATTGGRFYATPTERVEAGAIYFPDESSLLFGVAEYTVEAGNLGAFATEGTFVFEKPNDWLDSLGRKVFFRPSTGEIVNQDKKGDVLIGFQVLANVPDDKLGVVLTSGENSVVIIVTSTADSGAGSLRQAIADAVDGDVILFDADVFPAGQTTSILLSSYITINKSVSIYGGESDGQGGYTSGATKEYYVYRDVDYVRTKVVISSPDDAQEGETVLFSNVCRVALDGQGTVRGIQTGLSSEFTISGIAFNNGGVTISDNSAGTLDQCYVTNATAQNSAGIFIVSSAVATINDCAIYNCTTTGIGGGAYVRDNNNIATFNNCCFDSCSATNGGGFVSYNTSQSTLYDCLFYNCTALGNGGAAISYSTSQNVFNNCVMIECSAASGGAVHSSNSSRNTLNNCTLSNCNATSTGGAVYSNNVSINILNACDITNCTATNNGGGIYTGAASQNTLNDCTFDGCTASNGGGFYTSNTSQNTLTDCTITNCSANNGGGLYLAGASIASFTNCKIIDCTAGTNGGGVLTSETTQNTFSDCIISRCSAINGGGIYGRNTSQNTLNNCIFNDNITSSGNGTAFYLYNDSVLNLNNCAFVNNSVAVLYDSVVNINNSTFDRLSVGSTTGSSLATANIAGITTANNLTLRHLGVITINDGAALTVTAAATIEAATFTSAGRGYLAVAAGIDISSATLTNVVACSYGAGLESFEISADGATWTAQDLTTPILLEEKGDGDVWTTLSDDATGGSYSDTFAIGTTLRAFDGVRFFVASLDAYWQVEPFVVASNGGGGAGDDSPSWTISDATITPNAEEI